MAARPETTTASRLLLGLLCLAATAGVAAAETIPRAHGLVWESAEPAGWTLRDEEGPLVTFWPTLLGGELSNPAGWSERTFDHPALRPLQPDLRTRHWGWFHLDEILFLEGAVDLSARPGYTASAGLRWDAGEWELVGVVIQPHRSVGRSPRVERTIARARLDRDPAPPVWVAVVPLDTAAPTATGSGLLWSGATPRWNLALVAAPTPEVLDYALGQAWSAFAGPDLTAPGLWQAPALCARCQSPTVPGISIHLSRRGGHLGVDVAWERDHHRWSPAGFRLGGADLGRWLVEADGTRARYRIPETEPLVSSLLRRSGNLQPELLLASGERVRPQRVDLERGPRATTPASSRFPSHLRADLVEAQPNPFHEQTTLRVTVPATLGDSFDFAAAELPTAGLDLAGPSPVGSHPEVRIRVYNVGGKLIRTLDQRSRAAGTFGIPWDGQDDQGRAVAAGAYYVNVEIGDWSVTRRVLRLKP